MGVTKPNVLRIPWLVFPKLESLVQGLRGLAQRAMSLGRGGVVGEALDN